MSIKLEDYEDFLKEAAPEVKDVLESTFQEASRVMSPSGLQIYMDGAKSLCNWSILSGICEISQSTENQLQFFNWS